MYIKSDQRSLSDQELHVPRGIPLTPEEQNRRRHQIFGTSVNLFLRNGFQETSIREIAEEAGLGKSTLYDYFPTKDDILAWGVEDEFFDLSEAAQQIAALPLPAVTRLRKIMKNHVEVLAAGRDFYLKLSFEVQRLSLETQRRIQVRRHAYQDLIRQLIDEGIKEGAFRKVDSLFVARMLIVAVTPTIFTTRPTGTPQQMLNTALDVFFRGIQA
jgi:TetR/AcrR family transcriptional regulator, cholesterol catabolism regulator